MSHTNLGLPALPGVPDMDAISTEFAQLGLGDILDRTISLDQIPPGKRAVLYLRVSDPSQVKTDYDPLGQSIPSQRMACQRKADELDVTIIDEYVEPGESATEMTKRIAFRQMIARITQLKDVDYVIVYMFSRMARNRFDDAILGVALNQLGVSLVSATERIDETPTGQLLRGMLAVVNEYQSKASGVDISFKMGEKAKRGGTLGLAPLATAMSSTPPKDAKSAPSKSTSNEHPPSSSSPSSCTPPATTACATSPKNSPTEAC